MGMACGHALLRRINVHLCVLIIVLRQLRCSIGWQFRQLRCSIGWQFRQLRRFMRYSIGWQFKQLRRFMKCFIDWLLRQLRYRIGWLFCWGVDALFVCANSRRFSV